MQKQKCKILGLLVVVCMLVTALPIQVFAEEFGVNQLSDGMEAQAASETTTEESLTTALNNGGTVTLNNDVEITNAIIINNNVTLDLNGHNITVNGEKSIWDKEQKNWSIFSVRENGNLTIKNEKENGGITAKKDDSYVVDVRDSGRLVIDCTNTTNFVGNISAVYVFKGDADINGGRFSIDQKSNLFEGTKPYAFLLNCYDDNAKNNNAKITVTGGVFVGVNPSDTKGDPEDPTNYVAEGYVVDGTAEGDPKEYTVIEKKSVEITKATLHDTSGRVADNDLCANYKITGPDETGKILVEATDLRIHKNAQNEYGHWAGVEFKAPEGYVLKYKIGDEEKALETSEDGTLSYYLDTTKATSKSVNVTIELDLEKSGTKVSEKTYTIGFSGVKAKSVSGEAYYSNFADENIVEDCKDQTMYVELDEPLDPDAGILFEITPPEGEKFYVGYSCAENAGALPTKFA